MKTITVVFLILAVLSVLSMGLGYLALHDIFHDYVGRKLIAGKFSYGAADDLPEWTACRGEWNIVTADFLFRILFMIFAVSGSIVFLRKNKTGRRSGK